MLFNALGDGMCMHDILQHEDGSRVQPVIMQNGERVCNDYLLRTAHIKAGHMLDGVQFHIQTCHAMPCLTFAVRAALGVVLTCGAVGLVMVAPEGGPETTGRFLFFF